MKTREKKRIFLRILNNLFGDNKKINHKNCIKFYDFLIDVLDGEIEKLPIEKEDEIAICFSIVELLCNFDIMEEEMKPWDIKKIKRFLRDFSGLDETQYQNSMFAIRKSYALIKEDFLINNK